MDYRFFHPGKVDFLTMFFKCEEEKREFLSNLDTETQAYILTHGDEFHSIEELEEVINKNYKKKKQ